METKYANDVDVPVLKLAGWDTLAGSIGHDSKGYRRLNSVFAHGAMNEPKALFRWVNDCEVADPTPWCPREYRWVIANYRDVDVTRTAFNDRFAAGR